MTFEYTDRVILDDRDFEEMLKKMENGFDADGAFNSWVCEQDDDIYYAYCSIAEKATDELERRWAEQNKKKKLEQDIVTVPLATINYIVSSCPSREACFFNIYCPLRGFCAKFAENE